jgi:hypothetical protein
MKLPGKRFGPPPLKGPDPKGLKIKPGKIKPIPVSDNFPRFKNGGLSNNTVMKKYKRSQIG